MVVVAPPDATRSAARDTARSAAIAAGRSALLDEATAAAREVALRAFARGGFSGTWAATDMAVSVASARDRVAVAAAFEEAATAAVAEDLIDDDTLGVLRSTSTELADLTGLPSPGSLSALTSPAAPGRRGPVRAIFVLATVLLLAGGIAAGSVLGLGLVIVLIFVGTAWVDRRRKSDL